MLDYKNRNNKEGAQYGNYMNPEKPDDEIKHQ
jgi:hypothetical protein